MISYLIPNGCIDVGKRARILVAAAWILSAVFSTPMLVLYEEGLVQGQVQCWIDLPAPWQWQLYLTLVAVSLLVLPALLIFACYIVIVRTIWVQSAALTSYVPTANRNNNNTAGMYIYDFFFLEFFLFARIRVSRNTSRGNKAVFSSVSPFLLTRYPRQN